MKDASQQQKPGAAGNTAGFQFIVTTTSQKPDKADRRLIKSHIARGRNRAKAHRELPSWCNERNTTITGVEGCPPMDGTSVPKRVGSDLSCIEFPEAMKPYMLNDVIKYITVARNGVYPMEVCLQTDPVNASWFGCLLTDTIYLQVTIFSAEAFLNPLSVLQKPWALLHYATTLRLLQERLALPDVEACISNPTIMVVLTLAGMAEYVGDRGAAMNHRDGLFRMVCLRGGLQAMHGYNGSLRIKVCRVDLSMSLCFGCKPLFFRDGLPWESCIARYNLIRSGRVIIDEEISAFISTLDGRLANAWKDLHEFSLISNLAYQTKRKLDPRMVNEVMLSIVYRLLHLGFDNEPINEVIRVGLVGFATTIFLGGKNARRRYSHLAVVFRGVLGFPESSLDLPLAIQLWLLFTWCVYSEAEFSEGWPASWLNSIIQHLDIRAWDEVRRALKSVMWVDFLHDPDGKRAFEDSRWKQMT